MIHTYSCVRLGGVEYKLETALSNRPDAYGIDELIKFKWYWYEHQRNMISHSVPETQLRKKRRGYDQKV